MVYKQRKYNDNNNNNNNNETAKQYHARSDEKKKTQGTSNNHTERAAHQVKYGTALPPHPARAVAVVGA
jgi:maltose-binding protein MalE